LARSIPPQSGSLLPNPGAGPPTAPLLAPRPIKPARLDSPALSQANAVASSSKSPVPSRPPSRTERRFKCTFEGCDKAYTKPSRLAEHELTHTGEVCDCPLFPGPPVADTYSSALTPVHTAARPTSAHPISPLTSVRICPRMQSSLRAPGKAATRRSGRRLISSGTSRCMTRRRHILYV
jgi:hypothetical protein